MSKISRGINSSLLYICTYLAVSLILSIFFIISINVVNVWYSKYSKSKSSNLHLIQFIYAFKK